MTDPRFNRRQLLASTGAVGASSLALTGPAHAAEARQPLASTAASRAAAAAAAFDERAQTLQLTGYATPGDRGGALYRRAASEPAHAGKFRSQDRFLPGGGSDAGTGGWWELQDAEVDPRMFGAVCDGRTDDTVAVRAAMSLTGFSTDTTPAGSANSGSAVQGSRAVRFTAAGRGRSIYVVSGELTLYSGASVRIDKGAELRAAPGFAGEAILAGAPLATNNRPRNVLIVNDGTINCARAAPRGILVRRGNDWEIRPGRILAAVLSGVQCGQAEMAPETCFGISIDGGFIENFRAKGDVGGSNDPNSIGVNLERATDSRVSRCAVIGYRLGARSALSSNSFTDVHPWTTAGFGPMRAAFQNEKGDVKYIDCTADGMTALGDAGIGPLSGFCCRDSASLIGCTTMINGNTGSPDGECIAIDASALPPGRQVTVAGGFTAMTIGKIRFGTLFTGTQEGLVIETQPTVIGGYVRYGVLPVVRGAISDVAPNRDFSQWQRGAGPVSCGPGRTFLADRWYGRNEGEVGRTLRRQLGDAAATRFVLEVSQTDGGGDWAVGTRIAADDLAGGGGIVNLAILVRAAGRPPQAPLRASLRIGDETRGIASVAPESDAPLSIAWQRYLFRMPASAGTVAGAETVAVELLLPGEGRWTLQLARPSIWVGDAWLPWSAPARATVEAECRRTFEAVEVRGTGQAMWVPCSVRKPRVPKVTVSAGEISGAPTETGALIVGAAGVAAVVTFDAEI